jgi:DNA repair photolyase
MLHSTKSRSVSASPPRRKAGAGPIPLTLFSALADREASSPIPSSGPANGPASAPDVKPAAELTGIARLAASSPLVRQKTDTEYFLLPARSILNECNSLRMPFRWTVNPYRGCEFGCKYCYARYTHEYMELDGGEFERKIFVKQHAGELAERDLATKDIWGEHIAIGTATDPYQPAEKDYGATRAILERMAAREGLALSITTKSDRIVRDIDLLRTIANRSALFVNMTIITLRNGLARALEPRAPRPDLRLRAVRALREAGIPVGVHIMPVLPGINDRESDLDVLAAAAKGAGAQWLSVGVLFLMPSSHKQFLPFIEKRFPRLAKQYQEWYGRAAYAPEAYRKEIAERAKALREKHGLGSRPAVEAASGQRFEQISLALT